MAMLLAFRAVAGAIPAAQKLPMEPIGGHDSGAWEGGSAKDDTPDPIATGYDAGGHPELDPAKCQPTIDPWSTHCAALKMLRAKNAVKLPMAPIGGHESGSWEGGSAKDDTPDPIANGYAAGSGHPELDPSKCDPVADPWSTYYAGPRIDLEDQGQVVHASIALEGQGQ